MTFHWMTNQSPANGSDAMYMFKEMLKSAGWTISLSSDGVSNSGGGDFITSGFSGTNGFDNNHSWIVIRDPYGTSELCIQRGTSNYDYWIQYSPGHFFTDGYGLTTAPTVTLGTAKNIAGVNSSGRGIFPSPGTYYLQGGADDSDGYGFWMACTQSGSGQPKMGFLMEPLEQTDPLDTQVGKQNLFYIGVFVSGYAFQVGSIETRGSWDPSSDSGCIGFIENNWGTIPGCVYQDAAGQIFPGYAGSNPYSGKDDRIPIIFAKPHASASAPIGYKGKSKLMTWEGTIRSNGDTKENKARIVFGDVTLPWDGSTTPLI